MGSKISQRMMHVGAQHYFAHSLSGFEKWSSPPPAGIGLERLHCGARFQKQFVLIHQSYLAATVALEAGHAPPNRGYGLSAGSVPTGAYFALRRSFGSGAERLTRRQPRGDGPRAGGGCQAG
jgi:hypothetical protein